MSDTQKKCLQLSAVIGFMMLLYCPVEQAAGSLEQSVKYLPAGFKLIWDIEFGQRINGSQLVVQYVALGFVTMMAYAAASSSKR